MSAGDPMWPGNLHDPLRPNYGHGPGQACPNGLNTPWPSQEPFGNVPAVEKKLADAIDRLTDAVNILASQQRHEHQHDRPRGGCVTPFDLDKMERKLMSAISLFAEKQNAFNDKIDAAVEGLTQDVATLNAKIEELQNSAGTVTPEDQALLDAIETRSDAIAAKLAALDALTPPPVPAG